METPSNHTQINVPISCPIPSPAPAINVTSSITPASVRWGHCPYHPASYPPHAQFRAAHVPCADRRGPWPCRRSAARCPGQWAPSLRPSCPTPSPPSGLHRPAYCQDSAGSGQGWAGQGRAGQGRAGLVRLHHRLTRSAAKLTAGYGGRVRAIQGRAGQAGQLRSGQGRSGQDRTGKV